MIFDVIIITLSFALLICTQYFFFFMKIVIYSTISILSIIVLAALGIHYIAPYAILKPPRINEPKLAEHFQQRLESLSISTADDLQLSAYLTSSAKAPSIAYFILLHGIGGCKEHFLGLSNKLRKQGIASIVFDSRAHGQSEGQYCTYGAKEKEDISAIIDLIKSRHPNAPIGIWGNSMGGAVAIQAMALDKRIDFGIIESTFTDLSQIVFDYQKRLFKIPSRKLSNYVLNRAGEIADFNPKFIQPIESVKNITQPILIAHGDADKNIPFAYGQALFAALSSEDKEFVRVPNGGHTGLFVTGGKKYENKLFSFIDRQLITANHLLSK